MSEAYNKDLIKIAEKAAQKCKLNVHKGVYCYRKGPMFETPAEIDFYELPVQTQSECQQYPKLYAQITPE